MANSKIVTYDLCAPERNYSELYNKIKAYGVWAHICGSTWFISTSDTCSTVRDNLKSVLDKDDRLFVAELNGTAAWTNVLCNSDYLKKNL